MRTMTLLFLFAFETTTTTIALTIFLSKVDDQHGHGIRFLTTPWWRSSDKYWQSYLRLHATKLSRNTPNRVFEPGAFLHGPNCEFFVTFLWHGHYSIIMVLSSTLLQHTPDFLWQRRPHFEQLSLLWMQRKLWTNQHQHQHRWGY